MNDGNNGLRITCAPMEGMTNRIYRRAHMELFGGIDRYYAPFISVSSHFDRTDRSARDILPENNVGVPVIPQVLTNRADDLIHAGQAFADMGYEEINLNLGCPSGTVVAKGKGAGLLANPEALDRLLDEAYAHMPIRLSLKTRIGMNDVSEAETLFKIFAKYPVAELIVHPRLRAEQYRGRVHLEVFDAFARETSFPVGYNGDLFTAKAARTLLKNRPWIASAMLGRGLIANPALARELRGGEPLSKAELRAFYDRLVRDYLEEMPGEKTMLFHIKELSLYMVSLFPDAKKHAKRIRKANTLKDFNDAVDRLFAERELDPDGAFDMETTFPAH